MWVRRGSLRWRLDGFITRQDDATSRQTAECLGGGLLTALISIEDAWHTNQVQGHTQLGIGLDVEGLLSRKARGKARGGILAARKAGVRDVEQLRWVGRRRERIGISDARDEVLVNRAVLATPRRRSHRDGLYAPD